MVEQSSSPEAGRAAVLAVVGCTLLVSLLVTWAASIGPDKVLEGKGAGYADALHVGGGVVAWVNQIDPSQPSY